MTATEIATKLTADEQQELAEARAKISIAESQAEQHLAEHREVSGRYAALVDETRAWRKDVEAQLTELRQGILAGTASVEDLQDALRDLHMVELLEADFERQHDSHNIWDRLVQRPQARALNAGAGAAHSRRVVTRLTAKAEGKP